ncbi:HNH endonuclease [Priestia megaterium]|uniref:HNH endonuclease n=1 Tax=Priestia megaterium TaxID=1404 RepID=UPI003EEA32D9
MKFKFVVGEKYSRKDVKAFIKHPEPNKVGGTWGTGYASFKDAYFLFVNLDTAGRTGHNYPNLLIKESLYWYSKGESIHSQTLNLMMSGKKEIYIFTRRNSNNVNFTFQGLGYVKDYEDIKPAHIVWGIAENVEVIPKKYKGRKRKKYIEGARIESMVTRYERNLDARAACLDHYGYDCVICTMNFEKCYGELGKDFIHVHHEVEISTIGEEYEIDPIKDLKPVCPNCHAMLHKRRPAYSINELKELMV